MASTPLVRVARRVWKFALGGRGRPVVVLVVEPGWTWVWHRGCISGKFPHPSSTDDLLGPAPSLLCGLEVAPVMLSPSASSLVSPLLSGGLMAVACSVGIKILALPRGAGASGGLGLDVGSPDPLRAFGPALGPMVGPPSWSEFPPLLAVFGGPAHVVPSGPVCGPSFPRPVGPVVRGYIWIPRGSLDTSLGFPAYRLDMHRHSLPICRIVRSTPPPPLPLSFVEVVSMDKSRGSSNEAASDGKRRHEGSLEAASDLEYEVSLRSKLEAGRAVRD